MRSIDRSTATVPPCLAAYAHGRDRWGDLSPTHKQEIRTSLEEMQGRRCAYCEGPLDSLGQHIEHFRSRSDFVHLTFEWPNLYWCCDQSDSCGHYKDSGADAYNPNDLIDPCKDDPSHFLRFRSDGTIDVRPGLSTRDDFRARETLRVFNLHHEFGRLRNMRKAVASAYLELVVELAAFDANERSAYAELEIKATAAEPFSTVVRHMFEDVQ
ncbi:MAG: retron Ec78 anti-phage system effector HNH endonuclease PtuB [Kofleriaceae bacterium]